MTGRTIGVTLPIPAPWGARLDLVRAQFAPDSHEMAAHVTVLPPVDVDEEVLPVVLDHLAAVAAGTLSFRLVLAGVDSFRPVSPVVFVAVEAGAQECTELESRVRSGILAVEARFPYHPHVTIAHDAHDDAMDQAMRALAGFHADVPITAMALHERRGEGWAFLREFELRGRSTP